MRYTATVLKEIRWRDKTYSHRDPIVLEHAEMKILSHAGVIGNITQVDEKEFAVKEAPENAMAQHKRTYRRRETN
jgi:hypothetical protein